MARPSEYTPEIARQAWDYLDTYESKYGDAIPSIVGLACAINRSDTTLYNWDTENKPEFFGILAAIKEKQQRVLLNKGLTGDFNSHITKLVLGKHGYHEQSKVEATVNDYSNMTSEDRRRKLVELQQQLSAAEHGSA